MIGRLFIRVLSIVLLLVALVFFLALVIGLSQESDLRALPSVLPSAATFTANYLSDLLHGDLGTTAPGRGADSGTPVIEVLRQTLPRSLGLLGIAILLAVVVGLSLGIASGLRRRTRFSGALVFLSVLGISTPSYFAAMLLIWFNVWLYHTTGSDFLPVYGFGWDVHLILPAIVLAARPSANVMRLSTNALSEALDADHVRTARSKGLGPRIVFLRHVLRNAGVPLLTTIAVSLRFSLAVLPIVETIFSWSGVGQGLLGAIQAQDTTAAVGMVLPLALLFVLINLLLEILYLFIDPRLRTQEASVA
jgi:peptide/nickel transport system permease protein